MRTAITLALALAAIGSLRADPTEIRVDLRLISTDYVLGERVRGVVDVANSAPDSIRVGYSNSTDRCFVEVFRSSDMSQLTKVSTIPFVSRFRVDSGEGQKLETFLGDHYSFTEANRYLARPVLVHGGVRYEGMFRAFDVVDGVKVAEAMQMFSSNRDLQRTFEIVYWTRNNSEHLFVKARDSGSSKRRWETRDLGPILRLDKPTVSILPTGEVVVLHRLNQDQFVRSELWSLPNELVFRMRESVRDPETAGTARVRELYKSGGIKAKKNPWWKFW